ncbi:ABC-type transporter, periplasmic subunit [Caldalkalibacillus thermarum TA2.A1]|uniref:ABC-type transporter, periplasmic subunit n=1 Tax=Caldalkalibacillus thermarum (strain TA2.A1) TaxID=986075 RepID=F5L761_CALTT|nr:glutathione ABC transporter substrate-binding protein [Caldalkalibacillus thermarum]EGL82837.1 ABC-type transporter, periplasmic subunit [Caldalkalibacillus thermarum TA2.A1]QZT34859.1 glutathione ABC transporter substrate-binding protein [Caldalkalibacillus thermarum TA2.A1]
MKFNRKWLWLAVLVLTVGTVLAACGGGEEPAPEDTEGQGEEQAAETPAAGGDLKIAMNSDAVSLDPHGSNDVPSSNVANNIYETLVYQDENLEIQPLLAESWEQIDDTTWHFKLREDVTFTDGTPFNAEAVKVNLERILDPEFGSQRAFIFEGWLEEVNVVDEYTVEFKTAYPFSPILAHLAHSAGQMISPAAIEAERNGETNIGTNPVGTGPFVLERWEAGQEIVLTRNENYWGEPAKVDSITFIVVGEDATRLAMLETGDVHIVEPVAPSDVARVESSPNMELGRFDSLSLSYISFNTQKEPFNDVRVRQAISMAINKEEIIDGILEGTGIPAKGPLAPNVFGYYDGLEQIEYNPERAKELLAEAGYPDGFSTTIWTNDNQTRMDMAEVVQAQLKEIGIDVEIQVMEWGAYLEQTAQGEHDMFILGWVTVTADADYGLYALFHSKNHGEPGNRSFYSNPEVDELLDAARQESDPDVRLDLYRQVQEYLVEEAPMIYINHSEYLIGLSPKVEGYWHHPNGLMQLRNVTIND